MPVLRGDAPVGYTRRRTVSLDEDAYNLDAVPLTRLPWPGEPPTFGEEDAQAADGDAEPGRPARPAHPAADVLAALPFGVERWTCRLTPHRVGTWLAGRTTHRRPTLVVSAIDADPTVPLLLFWATRKIEAFVAAADWLRASFGDEVLVAAPDDAPRRYRTRLRSARPTFVDASYPAGNWRLLPRALRVRPDEALVIDAAALIDLYDVAREGRVAAQCPVGLSGGGGAVDYRLVDRGGRIADALREDEDAVVFAGPRLRERRVADPESRFDGGGELTFHLAPRHQPPQSPCIRCGWCVRACPTLCDPVALMEEALAPRPAVRRSRNAGITACIDCGLCSAVCPSRLPLHGFIDVLRDRLHLHATTPPAPPSEGER